MRLATNCIENASVNNIVILLQNCGSPEQLRHTHGYIKWSRMSPWGRPAANAPEGVSPEGHFEIRPNNPKEKKSPLNIRLFTRITMSFGGQIVWRDLIDRRNKKKSLSCHVHSPFSPDAFFYLRPPPPHQHRVFSPHPPLPSSTLFIFPLPIPPHNSAPASERAQRLITVPYTKHTRDSGLWETLALPVVSHALRTPHPPDSMLRPLHSAK